MLTRIERNVLLKVIIIMSILFSGQFFVDSILADTVVSYWNP